MEKIRIVSGLTHIDLAWKKSETEMSELFELFALRLIDMCERDDDYRYLLEQVWHLRKLKEHRPDLFEKICTLIQKGQIELASDQVANIDMNVVNGESIIRSLKLGGEWLKEYVGRSSENCAMIDTFGFNAQTPQILAQFGHKRLFADRFGARFINDVLRVRGLDNSEMLVVGPDIKAPYHKPGHVNMILCREHKHFEKLFEIANDNETDVQFTLAYTENETQPMEIVSTCMKRSGLNYCFGKLSDFMEMLDNKREQFDVISADLNPEFTGTFSLRHQLRILNRKAELGLLESEKAMVLFGSQYDACMLDELWWSMNYMQFHDVISGTQPTLVYKDCVDRFNTLISKTSAMITRTISGTDNKDQSTFFSVWNPTQYSRSEWVEILLPGHPNGVGCVQMDGKEVKHYIADGKVFAYIDVEPFSTAVIKMIPKATMDCQKREMLDCLDNGLIRIRKDRAHMLAEVIDLRTGRTLLKNRNDILVLQKDEGCFQTECITDSEIPAGAGEYKTEMYREGAAQKYCIEGTFPQNDLGDVSYKLEMCIIDGKPGVYIKLTTDWKAEHARLRLKLASELGKTRNYFEIPFGVIERKPYSNRRTARGEWPVHRFALMEDETAGAGIALINRGTVGVEVIDGTMSTSLLRAPSYGEYINLDCDDTSSDHGVHMFEFLMLPYFEDWRDSNVVSTAIEFNEPLVVTSGLARANELTIRSGLNSNIVVSSMRRNSSGDIVIRLYETTGRETETILKTSEKYSAYESDVREKRGKYFGQNNEVKLKFRPFEIKTILLKEVAHG